MESRVRGVGWILSLWLLSSAARAQPEPISFDEAIALSELVPGVVGVRSALEVRRAHDEEIRGTAQATQLQLMPGAARPSAPSRRDFEFQLNLTQSWNLQRLGSRARTAARAEREELAAQLRAVALGSRVEAAKAWLDLHTLERVEALVVAGKRLAQRYVAESEAALKAGAATGADVARARATAAELEEEVFEVHGARVEASIALAVASGRSLPEGASHPRLLTTKGPAPEPVLPTGESPARYTRQLERAPGVAAQRLAGLAARARQAEAEAQYAPLLQTGAQIEHADDTWVAYGVVGVTFRNNGAPGRAASLARAEVAGADARVDAALKTARAELAGAWHEVEHQGRRSELCEQRLMPALEGLVERQRQALAAGTTTVFEWLDAKRRALAASVRCERAAGGLRWARVRLWLFLSALSSEEPS